MKKGFTLIEAIIALALFMILSIGVLFMWQYAARNARETIRVQTVLDNISIAMDALIANIELSHSIVLHTNNRDILRRLDLSGYYWDGSPHTYIFTFNPNALPHLTSFQSLFIGIPGLGGQQFAYGIYSIKIVNKYYLRFDITITSACENPITITGSANIQHKHVTMR